MICRARYLADPECRDPGRAPCAGRLLRWQAGVIPGQQSEQALVKTLRSPGLHLDAGLRLVAALHEQALRTARRVNEHKPGGLDARVAETVHGATRQEHDITSQRGERLVAVEELSTLPSGTL